MGWQVVYSAPEEAPREDGDAEIVEFPRPTPRKPLTITLKLDGAMVLEPAAEEDDD